MNNPIIKSFELGDGRTISIETGRLAKQADGSVLVSMGDARLLATVVSAKEAKEDQGFFPLSVDYQEKFASAGRIPGSFFKREGRITDYEILISRLVDRALRPLFPDDYLNETQVLVTMISADIEVSPDTLAAFAASSALVLSDIPWHGPISEVRIAKIDGNFIVNPKRSDLQRATIDLIVAASMDDIMMVEGEANECSEQEMLEAIKMAHDVIKIQCQAQLDLAKMTGKGMPKREYARMPEHKELKSKIKKNCEKKIYEVAKSALGKNERKVAFKKIKEDFIDSVKDNVEYIDEKGKLLKEISKFIDRYSHDLEKEIIRNMMLNDRVRLDGRKLDEIRPLAMEVNVLPSPHGSSLFTRGETQALATVTLGTKDDELMLDMAMSQEYTKFILHYNFPAFSTGEIKPNRGPGRREVGHGNLAMRSLKQILPPIEENPYTIRIVSDILESNGSSSMATVCSGSLALMDAGVKVKGHCSGIAMGLITSEDGKQTAILSDILGDEDHLGDMDFKVTGTANGICGCQMDMKIHGLSYELLASALEQAKKGRLHILQAMNNTIEAPREDLKPHAPRIERIFIDREFIGAIIGPGGKIIQEIQRQTGTIISIEEAGEEGIVTIASPDKASIEKAIAWIKGIVSVPQAGEVYEATVKSIMPYGAFVEFLPGKEGLLHISEISLKRLESMDGVLNIGDIIKVKLLDVDRKTGKFKLSRKALLQDNTQK